MTQAVGGSTVSDVEDGELTHLHWLALELCEFEKKVPHGHKPALALIRDEPDELALEVVLGTLHVHDVDARLGLDVDSSRQVCVVGHADDG